MPNDNNGAFILVNVPGSDRVTDAFKEKVIKIASELGINPNFLMAVMSFETGETFSPSVRNPQSGAVGLIQFMSDTAKGLGTTQQALAEMAAEDQLDFVAKHFKRFKGKLKTIEDTYMAVLFPVAVGKGAAHVLFTKPSKRYSQNSGLDINRDGRVTVGEAADKVRAKLGAADAGAGLTLRPGAEGPEVQRLQEELVDIGYLTRAQLLTGPGRFGPQTQAALKNFQRDNHLDANGVFDAETQAAFRELNEGVKLTSRGNVVRGLQDRLTAVGAMTVAEVMSGLGVFGPKNGRRAEGVPAQQRHRAERRPDGSDIPSPPAGRPRCHSEGRPPRQLERRDDLARTGHRLRHLQPRARRARSGGPPFDHPVDSAVGRSMERKAFDSPHCHR